MEGLSFAAGGRLVGSTGKVFDNEGLWDIDKETGPAGNHRPLDNSDDYEAVGCPISEDELATLTVVEDVRPDGATAFSFATTGGASPAEFTLDDDPASPPATTKAFPGSVPGRYVVTQSPVSGFVLTSVSCDPVEAAILAAEAGKVSVNLVPGAALTCTFVNEPAVATARPASLSKPVPSPVAAAPRVAAPAPTSRPQASALARTGPRSGLLRT
ncbi:MAG: prealbumin-like fold domain-containing protein, partial [Acidimicrobiia bacterium]